MSTEVKSNAVMSPKELRALFEDVMTRRFFYCPSAEIYGGVAGLYDYGPCGCAVMTNLLTFWRQHFVLAEDMLEISSSVLTPEVVLKTSGHVDKFTDFMVKDEKTGEPLRADKLIEERIEAMLEDTANPVDAKKREELLLVRTKAGAMQQQELKDTIARYGFKSNDGNNLSDPFPFNLMFQTSIGPTGKATGYMRPETAQGIFINFRRLLDYNGGRMPFAAAQIGPALRNEISPRQGLLRVREFTLAEIEHFVNPNDKRHPKFAEVADLKLALLSRELQTGEDISVLMTVREAVEKGTINNETLGYFMARTYLFLKAVGIKEDRMRFRQHKADEMAHYAKDCWDAELLTTYGWVECVGHADRSCYDLESHARVAKIDLSAQEMYDAPKEVDTITVKLDAGKVGKTFRKSAKLVTDYLKALETDRERAVAFEQELKSGSAKFSVCTGEEFTVDASMVSISFEKKIQHGIRYTPSVIEPSFGVGRILYSLLEQNFYIRESKEGKDKDKEGEAKRNVLSLTPVIAPVKVAILPLSTNADLNAQASLIARSFITHNISTKTDASGVAIGRKYARMDEIGIPFAVTIDFDTLKDQTVTIRERDSTHQIRVSITDLVSIISSLVNGFKTWEQVYDSYPKVIRAEESD